jgi:hypothetical protein
LTSSGFTMGLPHGQECDFATLYEGDDTWLHPPSNIVKSPLRSSYEKGCQGKNLLPAPLRDAGVVTYIQPHLTPHLILRGVIGLVALARRTFPRQSQPQLLVPTRRFHEVSGARRRSVPKLRKLSVGLNANQDPM